MSGPGPVSSFPFYSTVGNITGTELLYLGVANVAPYKLTTLQLQTLYPASSAIAGTETIVNTTAGNAIQKTTVAQMISQLTAAGNPVSTDLFFSSQSGNVRKTQLSSIAAFSNVYVGGGTGTANTVTMSPAPTSYYAGLLVCWLPNAAANVANASLNVNGLGAVSIFSDGVAMVGGEIQPNVPAMALHDGTRFNLLNPQTNSELTIFTASGNFTAKSSGTYYIMAIGGGGGGGGGGGSSTTAGGIGGGGGSGGAFGFSTQALVSGSVYSVVIGAGGALGAGGSSSSAGSVGTAGNPTTFNAVTIGAGGAAGNLGRGAASGSGSSFAGINGGGNGGGLGGASVTGNNPGTAGTAAAANTGGGGGGGSGGATGGTAEAGGNGGAGGSGILVIRRA